MPQEHFTLKRISRRPRTMRHPICRTPEWHELSTNWNAMLNYYAAPGLIRNQDRINATIIIEKVSKYFDLTIPGIVSPSRMGKVVMARQISQYLLRIKLKMPYKAIGLLFNRDHTSIIHSVKYIRQQLEMKYPSDIITHLINIENQLLW